MRAVSATGVQIQLRKGSCFAHSRIRLRMEDTLVVGTGCAAYQNLFLELNFDSLEIYSKSKFCVGGLILRNAHRSIT